MTLKRFNGNDRPTSYMGQTIIFLKMTFDKKKKMEAFFEFDLYTNYFVTPGFNCRNIVRI